MLDEGGLIVGVIPDRIHVSPLLFRLLHRELGAAQIYYTTDCMSAAGALPGQYTYGHLELEVGEDQIVRQRGQTNFAGSALRPYQGVQRATEMLDQSWRDVWDGFSVRPADLMEIKHELVPGQSVPLCRITTDKSGWLEQVESIYDLTTIQ